MYSEKMENYHKKHGKCSENHGKAPKNDGPELSTQSGRPSLENSQSAGKWSETLARKRNLSGKKKCVKDLWKLRKWKHL